MRKNGDFSLRVLHRALDAQRQARGLSWAEATREMNGQAARLASNKPPGTRAMSASTVKGVGGRRVAEGDGVLAMLRWLDRTPESFVAGGMDGHECTLPKAPTGKVLRFDTKKLHAALDSQRLQRRLTWAQAAKEMGMGVSTLAHLAKGGRTAFPDVMRMTGWLRRPAAGFTRIADH